MSKKRGSIDPGFQWSGSTGERGSSCPVFPALSLNLNMKFWAEQADTPFWLFCKFIHENRGLYINTEHIKMFKSVATKHGYTTYQRNSEEFYFALKPMINKTEDVVVKDLANQIKGLIQEFTS